MIPFELAGGISLGWAVGNSDSANVFGTAVSSSSVRFIPALVLCAIFVVIGGVVGGAGGIATYSSLTSQTLTSAFCATLASACVIIVISLCGFIASASQSMVGAIIGIGIARSSLAMDGLGKIALAWAGTPVIGCFAAIILSVLIGKIINRLHVNIFTRDRIIRVGLIAAGCYGAYALGANNVANATGVFSGSGMLSPLAAALIGSVSIAAGVLCSRKRTFIAKVKKLIKLDSFSAFIAVLAEAVTVHFFALVGVPVSSGQALTGALFGIGLLKGMQTINLKSLFLIVASWVVTPCAAGALAYLFFQLVGGSPA
jgi:PiT family inorganic phosphate transporter